MIMGETIRRRHGTKPEPDRRIRRDDRKLARFAPGRSVWRWSGIALLAGLLTFGVGYGVAVFALFPVPTEADSGLPVPSLVGMTLEQARNEAQLAGLAVQRAARLPSLASGAGIILAQDPLAGQYLRAGATVEVAVSAAAPNLRVPALAGFDVEQAERLLRRLGFDVVRREILSDVPEGRLIRVEPPPGTERTLPARVRLIVSAGPPTLLVPDTASDVFGDRLFEEDTLSPLPPLLTDTAPVSVREEIPAAVPDGGPE